MAPKLHKKLDFECLWRSVPRYLPSVDVGQKMLNKGCIVMLW